MADISGSLYRITEQSITSDVITVLTTIIFEDALYDTGGFWNPANPTRLTFPADGKYLVGYALVFQYANSGQRAAYLRWSVGDSNLAKKIYFPPVPATDATTMQRERIFEFSAGDYVEVKVGQNSGSTLKIETTSEGGIYSKFSPILYAQKVG